MRSLQLPDSGQCGTQIHPLLPSGDMGRSVLPKQVACTKTSLGKASAWEKAEVACGLVEDGLLNEGVIREFLKQQF